jgi:hypothetical protein
LSLEAGIRSAEDHRLAMAGMVKVRIFEVPLVGGPNPQVYDLKMSRSRVSEDEDKDPTTPPRRRGKNTGTRDAEIRVKHRSGMSRGELAQQYGLSVMRIGQLVNATGVSSSV